MRKLDTILFDLDGTLINTNEIIIRSFVSSFKRHFPDLSLSREKITTFIGPTLHETYGSYTNDPSLVEEMIASYREFYVEYEVGNFEIYPQVEEVVQELFTLDDVEKPKPNKEPIITALSRFPSYSKAIMIGDNQGDILAGKNAGIYSAGVEWCLKGKDHLIEVNPDFMLSSMEDIYRVIRKINEE